MMSETKKRRVKLGAIFGAVSGAALFGVLYFVSAPNLFYAAFIPVAAVLGAAQMYMTAE
ncbi:MAG: hypothetical protein FWD81_04455 [Methanomassiliicoccaceae archaeon]|nr:hypothetical protein [Methanomassiliicoccaceae archaeon]